MKYVFVDPSGNFEDGKGHTGIATIDENLDWDTLEVTSISAKDFKSRFEYWRKILNVVIKSNQPKHVIIESFHIRNNGFTYGKMPETVMLIGVISYFLDALNIPYTYQRPNDAKGRFKDENLERYIPNFEHRSNGRYYLNDKIINDHTRDALKHLLFFKRYALNIREETDGNTRNI